MMNEYTIFGNTLQTWILTIGLALFLLLFFLLIKKIFAWRVSKWAEKTATQLDDFLVNLIANTKGIILAIFAIFFASRSLSLTEPVVEFIRVFTMLVLMLQVGFWLTALITYLIKRRVNQRMKTDASAATTLTALGAVAKGLVWSILLIMALDNIPGIEVSTLITGLGIGGIAIGLAVQNILGDLLASLSIVMDRPFVIGDFIEVGELMGTIEHIGIKSTRLRSLTGEQLVFSNSDLLGSRIRNYQRMERRRVVFEFGITYQTPYDKLAEIPNTLKEIITPREAVTFERAHFKGYGNSALLYEVVYWIEKADYAYYMDQQQMINLAVFKEFAAMDIQFAYPTQTLFMENTTPIREEESPMKAKDQLISSSSGQ
jgi:small-conductance mechanosensitive channel